MNKKLMSITIATFLLIAVIKTTVQISSAVTWLTDIRLTTDPSDDWDPAITQTSDGKIWVTWHSGRTGNYDIFYRISSDNGLHWSDDMQLTFDPNLDLHPSILQTKDGKIWIIWNSNRTGNMELFYKTSYDNGATWSGGTQLTTDPGFDGYPSIMQTSDGKIWVFWTSSRPPTPLPPDPTYQPSADIYYKVSSDGGQTWSQDTQLVTDYKNNYRDDLYPSAMQAQNGSVCVVWAKDGRDIYYKIYISTGWSWQVQLTFDLNEDTHPFIMQTMNSRIWVFWDSNRNKHDGNIYYKVFDGSWSNDIQLTAALEDDQWPSAMQAKDSTIWVAWTSPRYPQLVYDIFYRTGMELHDVAVRSITSYATHATFAFRGETIYIEVGVQNDGEGKETVEVQCYANSSLIQSRTVSLASGQYYSMVFEWNTVKVKHGMYVISANAVAVLGETDIADNSLSNSSVEVRILGDIVGEYNGVIQPVPDGIVEMDDFGMVTGHFGCVRVGPSWPHPTWDPVVDVNEDLVVDLDDIMIVGVHYGES